MNGIDLHTVQILLQPHGSVVLRYKTEAAATAGYELAQRAFSGAVEAAELADDYGFAMTVRGPSIITVMRGHTAEQIQGEADASLMHAHGQAKFQRAVDNDPMLRVVSGRSAIQMAGRG